MLHPVKFQILPDRDSPGDYYPRFFFVKFEPSGDILINPSLFNFPHNYWMRTTFKDLDRVFFNVKRQDARVIYV